MADMKFKFTIQPYQTEAVENVAEVFAGQPFRDRFPSRLEIPAEQDIISLMDPEEALGFANAGVRLSAGQLLENIRRIQARSNIKLSDRLTDGGLGVCALDVEMETGTGKTYVYIKTMFELQKRYGWSKFIVVVPSIAIREGVRKSFETMQDHFMEYYGRKARYFVYDSKDLTQIDQFSQSADLSVMIINIQAFNARGKDARRIRTALDDFGSRRPIDVIRASRPILILDEPQKMGGRATQESLREFHPLFCLNYSATHRQHHDLVYVLDAYDAYSRGLVKRIRVKGFDIKNLRGTDGYLYLEGIVLSPDKPPMARMELEIGYQASIRRETRLLGTGDDLFAISKGMEQYRGYRVSEIDPAAGSVTFTGGQVLHAGEAAGDVSEDDLRRVQIRETIRSHFEKERELFDRGIKTLSLFFIDQVAKYRKYGENGEELNAAYGEMFEQEYAAILDEYLDDTPYGQYLRAIDAPSTHTGYFSVDKHGRKVDSSLKRGSDESDDISAYDLIMRDKERLLSFANPVRFIFSHSALREGWDNPNIFQICTLKHGGSSPTQKRQEVGRGLRLCVNQDGDRMDGEVLGDLVQQVNELTVIAAGGYRDFVSDLQRGIREDLYARPTKASPEYFTGKQIENGGRTVTLSDRQGRDIYRYLIRNDYIDDDDRVTDQYRADLAGGVLASLPDSCAEIAEGVHALIQSIFDAHALDGMIGDGRETRIPENALNSNFYGQAFQTLWNAVNHRYAYRVRFDSEALIRSAIARLDERLYVAKLQYTVTTGTQDQTTGSAPMQDGADFVAEHRRTFTLERAGGSAVRYDLVGKIAAGANLTRRSAASILSGIRPDTFAMFQINPEEFITKAVRLIREQKAMLIGGQITYRQIEGHFDSAIFTAGTNVELSRAYRARKHVQDYVITDGYAKDGRSVERRFAEDLDLAEEVLVYAKLPKGFSIPTPVGNYTPDWAVVFHPGTVRHRNVIVETKGSMEAMALRPVEQAKIECARALFRDLTDVVYCCADSYQHLLDLLQRL